MKLALLSLVASLVVLLTGCGNATVITESWAPPGPPPTIQFAKIACIVTNATPLERRTGEDAMAQQIRSAQGIPSYTLVPDADLGNRELVRSTLQKNGIDGAIVLRLVAADKKTTYIPPSPAMRYSMYDWNTYPAVTPAYTETETIVYAHISLYSVADEKLLWAASSETWDPANVSDLVVQVAAAVRQDLEKRGFLKKPS
ncbi:MAG: hypothetical protein U0572_04265 [Phycisphaerales bacterium]